MSNPTKLRLSYQDDKRHDAVYDTMALPDSLLTPAFNDVLAFIERFVQDQGLDFLILYSQRTDRDEALDAIQQMKNEACPHTVNEIALIEAYILKQEG